MIVFNTTYCIDKNAVDEVLLYLKATYIPAVLASRRLRKPRLSRIMGVEEQEAESYSLEFEADCIENLEEWYMKEGVALNKALTERFGERVTAFATLLQPVDMV